ncbi:hypothetical protein, partial [Flammeovirga pacifica]|uniref:hypothetical protein n=1 Tax=Flammeovirga pacifica TaxID=915059 RepID=UPI0018FE1F00
MENSIKKPVIPRVSFSSRNLKDKKEVSIQFRIVLGSDRSSVSATGLKVLKKNWNGKNQYITPRNSIENKVLDSIKYQVREFYYDFCTKSKDYPNAESIKKAYIKGLNTSPLTLNEAICQFKEDKKKEVLES